MHEPESVFNAIKKCVDDYHGELKHFKAKLKEVFNLNMKIY